jgi:hypothetical protein
MPITPMKTHAGFKLKSSAGTLGQILGVPMSDEYAAECAKWIERGGRWIVIQEVGAKVEIGRAAHKLKTILGMESYKKVTEKFWLPPGAHYESHERTLQEAIQIFQFATRRGLKLRRDVPIDSYLKLMRYVQGDKSRRGQNRLIAQINRGEDFKGVSFKNTKALREKIKEVRTRTASSADDRTRRNHFNSQARLLVALVLRNHSTLVKASKRLRMLLSKADAGDFDKASISALERLHVTLNTDATELDRSTKNLRIRSGKVLKAQGNKSA